MYAVAVAEFSADNTADIFINEYITLWGCSVTLLTGNELQFLLEALSGGVFHVSRSAKLPPAHLNPAAMECYNHTLTQVFLTTVVNK